MATKLSNYDFSKPSNLTTAERQNYPWEQWFDGSIWKVTQGEDFHAHPLMMERIIRTRATSRKARVKVKHEGINGDLFGVIVFKRSDIEAPKPPRKAPAKKAAPAKAKAAPKAKAEPVAKAAKRPSKKAAVEPVAAAPSKKAAKRPAKRVI